MFHEVFAKFHHVFHDAPMNFRKFGGVAKIEK
jgi:hypothetical protein